MGSIDGSVPADQKELRSLLNAPSPTFDGRLTSSHTPLMAGPARKRATYEDVLRAPDQMISEVFRRHRAKAGRVVGTLMGTDRPSFRP
jgi:hypothetical protein